MEISPASISVVTAGRWGLKVRKLNETIYLGTISS
jgi:hypothetical protein